MATRRRLLEEIAATRAQLDAIASERDRGLYLTWVRAWDSIAADLEDAIDALQSGLVSGAVRARRAEQALQAVQAGLIRAADQAGVQVSGDVRRMVDLAIEHTEAAVLLQLPAAAAITTRLARADQAQIDAIVARVQQQITSRMWLLSTDATRAVQEVLVAGVAEGIGPRQQATRMLALVEGRFNGGLARARTIARTETIDAYRAAARQVELANRDVLAGWMWIADLGPRTCASCVAMHGSVHLLEEDGPDDHQNGRCTRWPIPRGSDVPLPAEPGDGERWLAGQPAPVQEQVLGKRGADRWRAGEWPSSEWSQVRHTPGWRDSRGPAKPPR